MGVNDTIADNGTYTMTNLKSATSIADNRLSAHNPSGAGNTTSFGDFICKALGYDAGSGTFTRLLRPSAANVDGGSVSVAGSYNAQDPPYYEFDNFDELSATSNDTFTVRVDLHQIDLGEYFAEQIGQNSNSIALTDVAGIVTLQNRSVVTDGGGNPIAVDFQFEVTGYGGAIKTGLTWDEPLNGNGGNQGKSSTDGEGNTLPEDAGLVFRTQQVDDGSPIIQTWHVLVEETGTNEVTFNFNTDGLQEGNVVYDPANSINAVFYMYDEDPSTASSYGTQEQPDFASADYPLNQVVTDFASSAGNRSVTFYCEIRDQGGTTIDVVAITVDENETGTWGSTQQCHIYSSPTSRNQATISDPYIMNYSGTC